MVDIKEKPVPTLLEEYDYIEKIRILSLTDRIKWFVANKASMSHNTKWDAFYDIVSDYEIDDSKLLVRVNKVIRQKGLEYKVKDAE